MDLPDNRGKGTATLFAIAGTLGHLVLLILAAIAAAAVVGNQLWQMIMEAGWFIWLVVPGAIVGMVVLVAVGVWFARRADSWSWVPILPSSLLMLTGVAGVFFSLMKVESVLSGESVDASQKARIMAQGIAESLNLIFFGGLLAMMLASAAATVLTARALARVGKKRAGTASGVALLLGMLSIIIVTLSRFVWPALGQAVPFGVVPALIGVVAVTVAALSLTGPREGLDNPAGALGDSIVAGLCAIAGVAMAAIAVRAQLTITTFSAAASVSPAERAALLSAGWNEALSASLAHLIFAAPIALALLGPLGTRLVYLGRALMRTGGGVAGVLVAGGVAFAVPFVQMQKLGVSLARMSNFTIPADVTLPQAPRDAHLTPARGGWIWVGRDSVSVGGTPVGKAADLDSAQGCAAVVAALKDNMFYGGSRLSVGADAATPYSRLACVLAGLRSGDEPSMGVALEAANPDRPKTMPPFDQARPEPEVVNVGFVDASAWTPPRLHVHLSQGLALIRAGAATDGQTKKGSDAEVLDWLRTRLSKARDVTLTADPSAPSSLVASAAALCGAESTIKLGPAISSDHAFDLGAPAAPASAASSGSAAPATPEAPNPALTVTGSLSAESVSRVVNQNRSKIRACYEQGLRKNPDLQGSVAVEFTIAKSGKVTASKVKDSTLGEPKVEQCIAQVFRAMSFPMPADGEVLVSYPLKLTAEQ